MVQLTKTQAIINTFKYVKENDKALHLIGLVSDGGIHSHLKHLYKLCELSNQHDIDKIYIHAFTDGRDCDPKSGKTFIENLEKTCTTQKLQHFVVDILLWIETTDGKELR